MKHEKNTNREAKSELNKLEFDELSSTKAFNKQVQREVQQRLNQADYQLEERRERYLKFLS